MEEQGADSTWTLLDRFEWSTLKLYMDRFSIIPYMMLEKINKYIHIYIYIFSKSFTACLYLGVKPPSPHL